MFQIDGYKISEVYYRRNNLAVTNFTLDVFKIVTNGTDKFKFLLHKGMRSLKRQ